MSISLIKLVLVIALLVQDSAQGVAPGDEEQLCDNLRAIGVILTPWPDYDPPMMVLMDTWNYNNLFPPRTGAVWESVDNDNNNPAGTTTSWIQNSNAPCQQSAQVCGFIAGLQDNWLITQLINRTVNGTRLPQVSVIIEFEQRDCDVTLNCQRTFNTHVYERSSENTTASRITTNYRQVTRVSPDDTSGNRVNETVVIDFAVDSRETSFYFAVQEETSCIVISRMIVFYNVCPQQTFDLIHYPQIIAPRSPTSSNPAVAPITVTAQCIANAIAENGANQLAICSSDGLWSSSPGKGCMCLLGHANQGGACLPLQIDNKDLSIGQNETITCSIIIPVDVIEWLNSDGEIIANETNTEQLSLTFYPVNVSIHNRQYTCRANKNNNKTITISVSVPDDALIVEIHVPKSIPLIGEMVTVNCSAKPNALLMKSPVLTLKHPNGTNISSGVETELSVVFHAVLATDAGEYTCIGEIVYPELAIVVQSKENLTLRFPELVVEVRSSGNISIGSRDFKLTCNVTVSRPELLDDTISYQWIKNNGTQVQLGSNLSNLFFPTLRLSDAGQYTCLATVNSPYADEDINSTSSPITVTLSVPQPVVRVVSNASNPILSGSSPTLTCTVELNPAVDVPVNITTVWTRPDGSTLTSDASPVMKSLTYYTTNVTLNYVESAESGNYTCTVSIRGKIRASVSKEIIIGVHLSLKGVIYPNNSVISITEIEQTNTTTNLNNGLQCISDRRPCCRVAHRAGEWLFPNGIIVPINADDTSPFYRNRGFDDGTVNLNRRNNSLSPTGRFCCVVPDALDVVQTVCAYIAPDLSVAISTSDVPNPGDSYTLTCTNSGTDRQTMNYQWTKNNGTQTQVGTNSNTLILPFLRLSDRGKYTFPPPTVCLVSDKPNPILSGTTLLLTCSIEFSSVVDVPLSISTVWTGPDDSNVRAPLPIGASLTHYTSSFQFSSVGLADSGEYTCAVNIGNEIRASVGKVVTVGDAMFQLKLTRMEDCQRWTHDQAVTYTDYIEEALVEAIKSRCKCCFSKENLLEESYSCDKSPNFTTYRNTLIGKDNFNSTQIIKFIQDWVNSGPKIRFDWFTVRVESTCSTAIATLEDPECEFHGS